MSGTYVQIIALCIVSKVAEDNNFACSTNMSLGGLSSHCGVSILTLARPLPGLPYRPASSNAVAKARLIERSKLIILFVQNTPFASRLFQQTKVIINRH